MGDVCHCDHHGISVQDHVDCNGRTKSDNISDSASCFCNFLQLAIDGDLSQLPLSSSGWCHNRPLLLFVTFLKQDSGENALMCICKAAYTGQLKCAVYTD